jgi:glycosyltransferase involved in cell wall biosynthesis
MKVSVCLAAYNGSLYILEQVDSILKQLDANDELIIVDDASSDSTLMIIESLRDPRIKIIKNIRNIGHVKSFEKALIIARNDYIFLSDQDDVWLADRVKTILASFSNREGVLVTSNFSLFEAEASLNFNKKNYVSSKESKNYIGNVFKIFMGRINYYGCTMALDQKLLRLVLPFPNYIESHDIWIALVANLMGSNLHLDEITLLRRIHDNNVTKNNRSILLKLRSRVIFFVALIHASLRLFKLKNI